MLVSKSLNLTAYLDVGMINNGQDSLVNVDYKFYDWYKEGMGVSKGERQDIPEPHILIGGTYLYDYNTTNVTRPDLAVGMLEVGIW
jgi:uncharacterized protein YcfL